MCGWRWHDHRRAAKRQWMVVMYAKGEDKDRARQRGYRRLVKLTERVLGYAKKMADEARALSLTPSAERLVAAALSEELTHYIPLVQRVIAQTPSRVLEGRKVPAKEKLTSIFEPHTDIIVKDRRETRFGHKVTLTSTGSNLIADCVIDRGNPADATLAVRSIERVSTVLQKVPTAVSFDDGFASKSNLVQIKALGIENVAFHKKCRLRVKEMVKSDRVYRELKNFRAGVKNTISTLERGQGMGRCRWRGWRSFEAYVWNCIVSFNLMQMARMRLGKP